MPQCFPVLETDSANSNININEILQIKKHSCFLSRIADDAMSEFGIFTNDIVVVDKSIPALHNSIVLVAIYGEFSIKKFFKRGRETCLLSGDSSKLELFQDQDVIVFGVVTERLRRFI